MTYKTIVTDYAPKAKKMADEIEKVINEKSKRRVGTCELFRDQFLQGDSCVSFAGRHRKMIRMQKKPTPFPAIPPTFYHRGCSCIGFALYSKHLQYRRQSK